MLSAVKLEVGSVVSDRISLKVSVVLDQVEQVGVEKGRSGRSFAGSAEQGGGGR